MHEKQHLYGISVFLKPVRELLEAGDKKSGERYLMQLHEHHGRVGYETERDKVSYHFGGKITGPKRENDTHRIVLEYE